VKRTENSAALPPAARQLIAKLNARTARVGVVGLGYVGLPLVEAMACGCPVVSSNIAAIPEVGEVGSKPTGVVGDATGRRDGHGD